MDRSPGFGSIIYDLWRAINTRFRFGYVPYIVLNLAIYNNSLDRSTKSTTSHFNVLCLLVNIGFQILFHSPPGVLFTFPSRYQFTIGHQVVFSLTGWSPHVHTRFHVPRVTLDTVMSIYLSYTGLSPSMVCFSKTFLLDSLNQLYSPNPMCITTHGLGSSYFARHYSRNRIFSFFSCRYLDVSVPCVPFHILLYLYMDNQQFTLIEFPHSEIYGSMDMCSSPQLIAAYHVFHRLLVPRHSPYALSSLTYFHCFRFELVYFQLKKSSLLNFV